MSNLVASFPNAIKREFYFENDGWDAHIKVDYDTARNPISFLRIRETSRFLENCNLAVTKVIVSTTRKGYHLRIWLDKDIGPYRTLRIQSMLGDDPQRQKFNMRRVRKRMHGWNVLWNGKWKGTNCVWKEKTETKQSDLVWRILSKESLDKDMTEKIKDQLLKSTNKRSRRQNSQL